jgi:hypothetical protein
MVMRPKLTVILAFFFLAIATSGYLLVKSATCKAVCDKCGGTQTPASSDSSGGGDGSSEPALHHFIVSTLR